MRRPGSASSICCASSSSESNCRFMVAIARSTRASVRRILGDDRLQEIDRVDVVVAGEHARRPAMQVVQAPLVRHRVGVVVRTLAAGDDEEAEGQAEGRIGATGRSGDSCPKCSSAFDDVEGLPAPAAEVDAERGDRDPGFVDRAADQIADESVGDRGGQRSQLAGGGLQAFERPRVRPQVESAVEPDASGRPDADGSGERLEELKTSDSSRMRNSPTSQSFAPGSGSPAA